MAAPKPCEQCGRLAFEEEMVTIPAAEYRELLERPTAQPFMWKPARSAIGKDQELGDYIIHLAKPGTMLLREIKDACDERFGPARAPSISAIHRFIQSTARGERPQAQRRRV